VTTSLNIKGDGVPSLGLPCPGYVERDSGSGFDGIGVEGSFVDRAWALSLVYFGCTEIVLTNHRTLTGGNSPTS
jgi:hypothetical protein